MSQWYRRARFTALCDSFACYAAFDCLWLKGRDLCDLRLVERKRILRELIPPQPSRLLYLDHVAETSVALYHSASELGLEGIVAKWARAPYSIEPPS